MPVPVPVPVPAIAPADADAGRARRVLAATVLASSLAFVDASIVNVALPAIGRDLGAGGAALSWVVSGYLLPLTALLLIGGAAGDRFGRRRLLVAGIVVFALASLGCALAPGIGGLLAARVGQGIGAALLVPNSLSVLGTSFAGEARGRAIGIWAAAGAAAGAIGPLAGGGLVDAVGWRAVFLINLPIAIAAIWLAWRNVPGNADADADADADAPAPAPAPAPLDLAGAALATAGLAMSAAGLTVATQPDPGRAGWVAGAAVLLGAASLAGFVWVERRRGDAAMLPPTLFASPRLNGLMLLTFLLYGALGAAMVSIPYVLIDAAGASAIRAGAALLPLPLAIAVLSPTMGRLAGRFGARWPLTLGPLMVAAGLMWATRIGAGASYLTTTLPAVSLIALGMAAAVAPLTTAVLASVDDRHTGIAAGFNSAVARGGGLFATALLGSLLATRGAVLEGRFRVAMCIAAAAAIGAAVCAFYRLKTPSPG